MYNNKEYLNNNPGWHEEDSFWKASKILKIIKKNNLKIESFCEIGCGSGQILVELEKNFKDCTFSGYDISTDAYTIAKGKETDNIKFYNSDLLKTETKFDCLLMIDVFEHVPDYMGFINDSRRNSDKFTIFHVPLDISVQKILSPKTILFNRYNTGHLHYFCKETALAAIKDCGYEVIDCSYTKWGIELPQRGFKKKIGAIVLFIFDKISEDLAARFLGGFSLIVLAKPVKDLSKNSVQNI